jgi:hypothetical protein
MTRQSPVDGWTGRSISASQCQRHGHGIDTATARRPSSRSSRPAENKGGLGLDRHGIVKQNGGSVKSSAARQGATFHVYPLAASGDAAAPAVSRSADRRR